jgi:iron complex transport system ATP-binding protein
VSIIANDLTVSLGRKEILHGVDFVAAPGQMTAIAGPNGSGKSTLMKALCGEVEYRGDVTLNDRDLGAYSAAALAQQRGVLPQATTVAFPFRVSEIVALGLMSGHYGARADLPLRALDRVGLQGYGERLYQELSGGEQQRVQLARVLVQVWEPQEHGTPRWLLLDEPVSSLDIAHQLQVMHLARDYARAGGGVISVMHDLNLPAMFADRIVLMQSGRVAAEGPPPQILREEVLSPVYECRLRPNQVPVGRVPFLLPQSV